MRIIRGDLIRLALQGKFDLIAHGCNCQAAMGAGIAKQIKDIFPDAYKIDQLVNEHTHDKEDLMGQYSSYWHHLPDGKHFYILNLYTQLYPGLPSPGCRIPFDYEAFITCLRKINVRFRGQHIGLPLIGCGLARADKNKVLNIINGELISMDITIVEYESDERIKRSLAEPRLGNTPPTGKAIYTRSAVVTRANFVEGIDGDKAKGTSMGYSGPFRGLSE